MLWKSLQQLACTQPVSTYDCAASYRHPSAMHLTSAPEILNSAIRPQTHQSCSLSGLN